MMPDWIIDTFGLGRDAATVGVLVYLAVNVKHLQQNVKSLWEAIDKLRG